METDRAHDTSEQSRRDALADAETLILIGGADRPRHYAERGSNLRYFLSEAVHAGECAILNIDSELHGGDLARDAARAAFRACPGLRGEP